MALINCPECGKEISDKAKNCPNCGCPAEYCVEDNNEQKSFAQPRIEESYDENLSSSDTNTDTNEKSGGPSKFAIIAIVFSIIFIIVLMFSFGNGNKYTGTYNQWLYKDSHAPKSFKFEDGDSGTLRHPSGVLMTFTYEFTNDTHIKITANTGIGYGISYSGYFSEKNGSMYFILDVWDVEYKRE